MMSFVYAIEGLDDMKLDSVASQRIAAMAVNRITKDSRTEMARRVLQQVNFPASYVAPSQGRLAVTKQASGASLEARIKARGRATSLARFAKSGKVGGQGGVAVSVKPGKTSFMRRAFLIPLRAGNADIDTKSNLGLAIRLRPGERPINKKFTVKAGTRGLYLLYGPSVSQIILDNAGKGVVTDLTPSILDNLENEILRLMDL